MVAVQRIGPEDGLLRSIVDIRNKVRELETKPSGNIVIRETLKTTDPVTGVETIIGKLPDGSFGVQPFINDTTPPPVPTTPVVVTQSGTVIATWDGKFVANAPAPRDFQFCRIYGKRQSDNVVFLLGSVTNTNDSTVSGAGVVVAGQVWTFWATSVDYNGNESSAGTSTSPITIASVLDDTGLASALTNNQTQINAANAAIATKNTVFKQSTAPTANKVNDTWFDTSNGNKPMVWNGSAWVSAQDASIATAQSTADGKNKVYNQTTQPTGGSYQSGDLWFDTSNNNKLYTYSGSAWVLSQDSASAQTTANSKTKTFIQGTTPTATTVGDIWIDTSNGNVIKTWEGSSWVTRADAAIAAAQSTANTAQTVANGKNTIVSAASAPTTAGHINGDIWFDTANGNKPMVFSTNAWVSAQDASIATAQTTANSKTKTFIQGTSPTATTVGDIWIDTANGNVIKTWEGSSWVSRADAAIAAAQTAATAAQTTANGRNTIISSASAPATAGHINGDVWFDTSNGNKPMILSGTSWVSAQDSSIATAQSAANTAQTTANGKNTVVSAASAPATAGHINGDIWFDTANGNKPMVFAGTAWTSAQDASIATAQTAANTANTTANSKTKTFIQGTAPTATTTGDIWIDTANGNVIKTWEGSSWINRADTAIATAQAAANTAQTAANGKNTVVSAASAPATAGHINGDIWFDTSNGNKPMIFNTNAWLSAQDASIATAQTSANNAQTTANGKNTVISAASAPATAGHINGDIWFDTANGNKPMVFAGTTWSSAQDASIATAQSAANAAQTSANGKNTVISAASAPATAGHINGDIWFDTSNGNKPMIFNTNAWLSAQDASIATAQSAANTAQTTANGKNTVISAASAPATAGHIAGDIWFDTANGNKPMVFAGTAWTSAQDASIATAQTTANSKTKTFIQGTTPTATTVGDIWIDTANGNVIKTWEGSSWINRADAAIAAAQTAATNAQTSANGKNTIISAASAPATAGHINGDVWFDTANGNKPMVLSGTAWVSAQDASIATAQSAANTAQTTANGKNTVISAASAPATAGHIAGDIWFDTTNGNKPMVFAGTAWTSAQDASIATAQSTANTANTTANSKTKTFIQGTAPTATTVGDIWIDTANGNVIKTWEGASWITRADAAIATAQAAASAAQTSANGKNTILSAASAPATAGHINGDIWFDTSNGNKPMILSGTAWVSAQDASIATAQSAATAAQTTANGKNTIISAASAPATAGHIAGDIWFDTSNGNKPMVFAGTAWSSAQDASIATAQTAANTAQTTANGKNTVISAASAPATAGHINGDIWFDTANGNKPMVLSGTAWVSAQDASIATAQTAAGSAQTTANSKTKTFIQGTSPTATTVGDIWIDTANGNVIKTWEGASWVNRADAAIATAQTAANTAQTSANGKNTIISAASAPATAGHINGDIWFDTANGNKPMVLSGTAWVSAQDASIATAQTAANTAQTTANGKNTVTYSASAASGSGTRAGDVWFQTNGSNIVIGQWQWSGSAWVQQTIDNAVIANLDAAKITAGYIAAARIQASTISTDKLSIGDFTNLCDDPDFELAGIGWQLGGQVSIAAISLGVEGSATNALKMIANTTTIDSLNRNIIPVQGGDRIYGQIYVKQDGTGTTGNLHFATTVKMADGTLQYPLFQQVACSTVQSGSWILLSGVITVPANAVSLQPRVSVRNDATNGIFYFDHAIVRRQVNSTTIQDGTITTTKIATDTITAGNIAAGAITASELAAGSVQASHLTANSVSATAMVANTITAGQIASGTITAGQIAAGTITATQIATDTITAGQIAAGAITASELSVGSVQAIHLTANSVSATAMVANTITAGQIAAGTITAAQIAAGTITATQIATDTITAGQIAAGAITASELAVGSVQAVHLTANSISATAMVANTITAGQIASGTITAGQIAAGTITATQIATDTITAGNIAAGAVTASELAAGSVQAFHLTANSVAASAIVANTITAGQIAASTITTAQIAANTITASNIAADTITAAQIAASAITASELAAGSVQASHLTANSVSATAMVANTITAGQIAAGTITTTQIAANTITAGNIAADTITATQIAAGAITASELAVGSVQAIHLTANSVAATAMVANTITAGQIAAGTITAAQIAAGTITATQIATDTITAGNIAAGAVTASELAAGSVQASHLTANSVSATAMVANTITAGQIAAGTITAGQIAAGTITATQIATDTITAGNIAAGAITASELAAGSVQAVHLTANSVSATAMVANTITAGQIAAGTITTTQIAAGTITAGNIATDTITASQIAAGAITASELAAGSVQAGHLTANSVSATAMVANTVTAGQIAAGTITTTQIAAGTITANNIAAGTITADKILLADINNYVENPDFESDTIGQQAKGYVANGNTSVVDISALGGTFGTMGAAGNGTGKAVAVNALNGSNNDLYALDLIPVKTGDQFYIEYEGRHLNAAGTGNGGIGFRTYGPTKAAVTWTNVAAYGTTRSTVWAKKIGTYTVPAGTAYLQIWLNFSNNAETTNQLWFDNIVVRRKNGAELIVDGAIQAGSAIIGAGAIATAQIGDAQITTAKIANLAVTNAQIADATIASAKIANLDASKIVANTITAAQIAANTITASQIAANTITASQIAANTITASQIAANTITASQIAAGTITATQMLAGTITAASGIIGDINADKITSGTINASYIAVGSGTNALSDPGFNSTPLTNARTAQSTGGTAGWTIAAGTSTGLRKATRTTSTTSDAFSYLTMPHTYANAGQLIPVVAGQIWTLKCDTTTSVSAANVSFQVYTASADGTVATTAITTVSANSTSQRPVTATYTVPAGVTGFMVGLKCDTTGVTWTVHGNAYVGQQVTGDLLVNGAIDGKVITGATIQTATSGSRIVLDSTSLNAWDSANFNYFTLSSAAGVSIAGKGTNITRTRTNYAGGDCSFETGMGNWGAASGTTTFARDTAQAFIGTYSGKVTDTVNRDRNAFITTNLGSTTQLHTFSVYVRHNAAVARSFRVDTTYQDSSFVQIGSVATGSSVSVPANTWTRLTVTATPSSGSYRVLSTVVGIGMLSTETYWVDAVMFELSSTATAFFDGNTAPTGAYSYATLVTSDMGASGESLTKNVTIKAGANALWNPGNLTQALPGVGFVLDTPLAQTAGIFSDGTAVSIIEGNGGGAGGSRIDVGDNGGQHVSVYGWNGVSVTGRGGVVIDGQVGTTSINGTTIAIGTNGQATTINGRAVGYASYVEYTNTQTGAPNATVWGIGTPTQHARSTNTGMVTAGGGDTLTFNTAGIYSIAFTFHTANGATGRTFCSINMSYDSVPIARNEMIVGDDTCTATATVRVNAGEVLTFPYYQTSGGTTTVSSRIRIARISDI